MAWEDDKKYRFGMWTIHTTKAADDMPVRFYTEVHKRDKVTLLHSYWSSHGSKMPTRLLAVIETMLKKPRHSND